MKRLISLLVMIAMLAGMCIIAGAALPATSQNFGVVEDFEDGVLDSNYDAYVPNGTKAVIKGWTAGITEKYDNNVYELRTPAAATVSARKDGIVRFGVDDGTGDGKDADKIPEILESHNTYTDGEKVHLTSEIMIPTGSQFYYNPAGCPSVVAQVFADETMTGYQLGVKNPGKESYDTNRNNYALVTFNTGGQIVLFGQQIYTTTTWERDTWYTVDIVLVMGKNPQAAIYVNGEALRIDPKMHRDLTFDGSKTSTDYVKVGYRETNTSTSTFREGAIKGIAAFNPVQYVTPDKAENDTVVYVDNFGMKPLAATEEAEIYTPFGLAGIKTGDTVDRADLSAVAVAVPKWDSADIAKVDVTVDNAAKPLAEDAQAPFAFDLTSLERGIRYLTIKGYNAAGNVIKTAEQSLVVAGNELQVAIDTDFEGLTNWSAVENMNGAFYPLSAPHDNAATANRGLHMAEVVDKNGVSKGNSVRLDSWNVATGSSNRTDFAFGSGYSDYKNQLNWTSGVVTVDYDFYINNENITTLQLRLKGNDNNVLSYNTTSKKWEGQNISGYNGFTAFDAVFNQWQHWVWTIDYARGTVSLKINDVPMIDDMTFLKDTEFEVFRCCFQNTNAAENFLAIDNFKIARETTNPTFVHDMYDYNKKTAYSGYNYKTLKDTFGWTHYNATGVSGNDSAKGYIKSGVVKNENGEPVNTAFGESMIAGFEADDATGSVALGRTLNFIGGATSNYAPRWAEGVTVIEYDYYVANADYASVNLGLGNNNIWYAEGNTTAKVLVSGNPTFTLTPGTWQHHKIMITPPISGRNPHITMWVDGKMVANYIGSAEYREQYTDTAAAVRFTMNSKNVDNKPMANFIAVDNIKTHYQPVVPYISGIDFGELAFAGNKVEAGTTNITVDMEGYFRSVYKIADDAATATPLATALTLTAVDDATPLGTITETTAVDTIATNNLWAALYNTGKVTFNNVTLVAGKTYKIELAKGTAFDNQKNSVTTEPVSVYFTAVSELPAKAAATDGVQAVKFFKNRPNAGVEVYVPGSDIIGQDVVSAEALVNNTNGNDMNFNMILAVYGADGCLQEVSIGDCYVPAGKEGRVVSSGAIQLQDPAGVESGKCDVTMKAFLVDSLGTLTPLGPVTLSDPAAQPEA